ncbi:MAG: hypothetical protein A3K19_01055 [Lentisphaerae bacterium RIFOXYB12_FULL_65_16]|nr:MAG: hypothetical protein A3K18_04950 [Lentisphaerae bacterium RIFOXYA12_64_32]OGV93741.1 MAG: hypothetical protein A3K19_01055 [Lentisphaerae bacterium RIFOXYB12_FULL_65_16]
MVMGILTWVAKTNHISLGTAVDLLRNINAEMETKGQMEVVARAVQENYATTGKFPGTSQQLETIVQKYLAQRHKEASFATAVDRWGTRYQLVPRKGSFDVVSAGPDRQWNTADDISLVRFLGGNSNKTAK